MSDSQEDDQTIKVVDKRRFNESGDSVSLEGAIEPEKVDGTSQKASVVVEKDNSTPPTNKTNLVDQDSQPIGQKPEKIDFPSFLVGFYYQTLSFLGEIPNPESNEVVKNIEAAKQHIDILNLLEEKTNGNLTQEEEKLFTEILNNLRLLFVKSSKSN